MNSNTKENKIKLLSAFILMPLFVVILLIMGSKIVNVFPSEKLRISSNDVIVAKYKEVVQRDSLFLNQLAEAFVETKYKGTLTYNCQSPGCGLHTLGDYNLGIDLTDTFPKIRALIKHKYPNAKDSWYSYHYNNGIVFIDTAYLLFNQNKERIILLYIDDFIDIKQRFCNYILYTYYTIPKEPYNWLYQINKNWYICSPGNDIFNIMNGI